MIDKHSISILIPVYNEGTLLEQALVTINNFTKKNITDYELLIIQSGSTDNSKEICDKFAAGNQNVKVTHENVRNGFGAALKLGYQKASKDWIWLVTPDIPFPLETLNEASEYLDGYDCILSYRSHDPRGIVRRVQSFFYNLIIKSVLGLRIKHINSGFKILKRSFVNEIKLISNKWFIDAELLYWIEYSKCKYIELPVPIIERAGGVSSVGPLAFIGILQEMILFLRQKKNG